ncbi:MAG: ATP-dependent helicase [Acidobacteriia bacterium]|nr:ATP-dependent helicase [Terriglobia bacterium]
MTTLFDLGSQDDALAGLNEAQRRAVTHGEGPLLVIAGAGTGKTKVITERIRHLLASNPELGGENILGLTFTDKAAAEMKHRVVAAAGERAESVTLATFHSFCKELLAELEPERVLLDPIDHWILLRRNLARLKLEKFRRLADPGQFLSDFVEFFSRCQDELVSSAEYQRYADALVAQLEAERATLDEETYKERGEQAALQQEIARAYRTSEKLLREKKRLTFGALLAETAARLRGDAGLRARLQQRYRHILVDEFQDTNIAQLELLYLLAAEPRNILVVGDNDQAIYRFRGASFGSFTIFLERFAGWRRGADSGPWRVTLTENYRSMAKILRVATQVITQNEVSEDFPKKVLSAARGEGEKIRIVELGTPADEARWVRGELQRLHGAGHRWREFAILYRQHAHRDALVAELRRAGIPFFIAKLSILKHGLVRDVLAYLRLVARPYDDISCARVLAAPAWGLDATGLMRLTERAAKKRGTPLYDVLQAPQTELAFGAAQPDTNGLLEFLLTQRKTMRRKTAREILGELLDWLELAERVPEEDRRYVEQLASFLKEWEPKSETRSLPEFLEYLDFYEQAGGTISLAEEGPRDAVRLMTVHGAKGLEFPHVFILRMNAGAFPVRPRSHVFEFPEALIKEERPQGDFHIQEERRLFYVALTRARDRLTLTTLIDKKSKRSPFLDDFLMEAPIKNRDVTQSAPNVPPAAEADGASAEAAGAGSLFPASGAPPRLFSRIGAWAESYHPPAPMPLQLSASAIDSYRTCPQRYLFSKFWQLPEGPRAAMSFGSVMHTTIKRFVGELRKGNRLPFAEVAHIFETEWTSAGFEDDYQEGEYKKDGLEQLRVFHAALLAGPPQVLEQEKGFELPLDNNIVITGRIDQINSLGGRDAEIVDYKTGKPKPDAAARKDLQLSIYALAAREILELNPVDLAFHYLLTNEKQVTSRNAKQLDEAVRIVQEVAADIRAGEFPAKLGFHCRSCAYKTICPAQEESQKVQELQKKL